MKSSRRTFLKAGVVSLPTVAVAQGQGLEGPCRARTHTLRFAVASDGHFGELGTDFQRFHNEMIGWLNDELDGKGLDLVIFNGDLVHDRPELLWELKPFYDRLRVPYFVVKGNHDKASPELWQKVWGYGENFDFSRGEYGFILATTSDETGAYLCPDVDWIRAALERHRDKQGVFVFLHISQHGLTKHAVECPELLNLLRETPNVKTVFHGHDHDLDNVIYTHEKAFFYSGHMGGSWGTNYRGYRIVEIDLAGVMQTYQCNPAAFIENRTRIGG